MKQIISIFFLSFTLLSCSDKSKNEAKILTPKTTSLKNNIDDYFATLQEIGKFNGVIFASKNDTLLIHKAYNLNQDKKNTTYVTTESQFDIQSVSKLMAHYLIEKFEMEGKVKKVNQLKSSFQTSQMVKR
ncbi:hypothetical protein [Aquimarina sp. SS2-1]|uniref:hypothetical protein n=1 Tax=Aquimarina besae TaxID=3342247 RepID=UPI00366BFB06